LMLFELGSTWGSIGQRMKDRIIHGAKSIVTVSLKAVNTARGYLARKSKV